MCLCVTSAPSPLLKIPTLPLRENLRNMVLMELRLLRSFMMSACADSSGGGREVRWADMGWVQGMESGKRPVLRVGRLWGGVMQRGAGVVR